MRSTCHLSACGSRKQELKCFPLPLLCREIISSNLSHFCVTVLNIPISWRVWLAKCGQSSMGQSHPSALKRQGRIFERTNKIACSGREAKTQRKWEWILSRQNPQVSSTSREVTRYQHSVQILGGCSGYNDNLWIPSWCCKFFLIYEYVLQKRK